MSFVLKAAVGEPAQRASNPAVVDTVAGVIADIRANGDDAVRKYSDRFDRWSPDSFRLDEDQIREIVKSVPTTVLETCSSRSVRFATSPRRSATPSQTSRSRLCPACSWGTGTFRSTRLQLTFRVAGTR